MSEPAAQLNEEKKMAAQTKQLNPEAVQLIQDVIARRIQAKQWRSETEKEIDALARSKGADKAMVTRLLTEVRRQYDEAGAGFSGRFQS